jgi:urease accessory protein
VTTRIHLHANGSLDLATGALAPKLLSRGTGSARIALVGARALLLAGDDVRIDVRVAPGCRLELVEVAGAVAYDGRGGAPSTWTTTIALGGDARLSWAGEPFVVADGAEVTRSLDATLAEGAVADLRETFVLGRTGERGGSLRSLSRVGLAGKPLLVEDLDLSTDVRRSPAVLGTARCLDTLSRFGDRFEHPDALQLEGTGTLLRWLGGDQHRSSVPARVVGLLGQT